MSKKTLCLVLLIIFVCIEAGILYYGSIYSGNGLVRVKVVSQDKFNTITTNIFGVDKEQMQAELSDITLGKDTLTKALHIREWVMEQIKDETGDLSSSNRTPLAILDAMRTGDTGASCGYRALLYMGALQSQGIEARMLTLVKDNPYYTHATVSVLVDDDWVIIDPTFGVMFVADGELASASDIQGADYVGIINDTEVLNPVEYNGKGDLLGYFNYVSAYERRFMYPWQRLPVIQYFFGVSEVILEGSHVDYASILSRNILSLVYNFIIPLCFICLSIGYILLRRGIS